MKYTSLKLILGFGFLVMIANLLTPAAVKAATFSILGGPFNDAGQTSLGPTSSGFYYLFVTHYTGTPTVKVNNIAQTPAVHNPPDASHVYFILGNFAAGSTLNIKVTTSTGDTSNTISVQSSSKDPALYGCIINGQKMPTMYVLNSQSVLAQVGPCVPTPPVGLRARALDSLRL